MILFFLCKSVLNVTQRCNGSYGLLKIQTAGIVGVELCQGVALFIALFEEFVIIQPPIIGGHAIEVAHVDGLGTFLVGEQGLVHLFAVTDADDLDFLFFAAKQLTHGLCLRFYGAGGGFFDEQIAVFAMLESKEYQIDRLFQRHDESGHGGLSDGDGVAGFDLVDPKRNDGAAGAHDIAVTGAADLGLAGHPGLGDRDLLLDRLGHAHGVDGIRRLVGRETDDTLHPLFNGGGQHIVCADDVGAHRLHGEELAGGHLLERCGVKDVVHPVHGALDGLQIPHVANVEFDLIRHFRHLYLKFMAHIVLLLLIAGEDADLADVGRKKAVENGVAERAGPTGDHEGFVFE